MKITESTSISISLLITLAGGIGFVSWVAFQAQANTEKLQVLDSKVEALQAMQTDLAIIRIKVETIESTVTQKHGGK